MIRFLDLPEEIILEIIVQFLSISECVSLVSTCRSLNKFAKLKTFWLRIAQFARHIRPIPFDDDSSALSLPMETIRDGTIRSFTLGKMLKKSLLPEPLRVRELALPDIRDDDSDWDEERLQVEDMGPKTRDPQIWAWLLKDGKHLMSMSKIGILRVWDMEKSAVIISVDVMGSPLCWDYVMNSRGLTLIVNVETKDNELETFRVWRYDWTDAKPRLIFKKLLSGDIRSNWIEGSLTGCVGIVDDSSTFIYVVNWETFDEAYIETEFGFPPNLSAATSLDTLFIYAEDTRNAAYFGYSLSTLAEVVTKSMPRLALPPTVEQHFNFVLDGVDSLHFWIPTCRTLWDGRTGVFSRSMRMAPPPENFVADYVTVSIVNLGRDPKGAIMGRDNGTVTRHVAHWFNPETSELLGAPAEWDVCAMGTFAKTAIWMERVYAKSGEGKEAKSNVKICFAEFPSDKVEADSQTDRGKQSPNASDSDTAKRDPELVNDTAAEISMALSWWEDLIDGTDNTDLSISFAGEQGTPGSAVPASQSVEAHSESSPTVESPEIATATSVAGVDDVDDASVHSDDMPVEEVQPPVSFGHICEYEMDDDWEHRYGGIYTVDFDDARGIAAFATASGKIVLLEFV